MTTEQTAPEEPPAPGTEQPTLPAADSAPVETPEILESLASPDAERRAAAIENAAALKESSPEIICALENIAARDPLPELRAAALDALTSDANQRVQWRRRASRLSLTARRLLHREIQTWGADGLLTDEQVRLLQQRYPLSDPHKKAAPVSPEKPREKRTLTQILTSETAVQIALYLGAFFVISAALIFAAAVEVLRVPILGALSLTGFGVALGLFKKLRQASFVFFIIGSFLFVIAAGVLIDQVEILSRFSHPAWLLIWFAASLILLGGTLLYRSRLLSVFALWSATAAAYRFGNWLEATASVYVLLSALPLLPALGLAWFLRRWQGRQMFWPLFVVAQVQQIWFLGGFAMAWLFSGTSHQGADWFFMMLAFLAGAGFYLASDVLTGFVLFPVLAIGVLLPAPLLGLMTFDPALWVLASAAWAWGAAVALGGQILTRLKRERVHPYGRFALWGSAAVLFFAGAAGAEYHEGLGLALAFLGALLYLGLAVWRQDAFTWTAALIFGLWAYLMAFALSPVAALDIPVCVIFLLPALILLSGELLPRRWISVPPRIYWPPRVLGLLAAGMSLFAALLEGGDLPWVSVAVLTLLAGFAVFYALVDRRPWLGAAAAAVFALSIPYAVHALAWDHWLILTYTLALLYWAAGSLLMLPAGTGSPDKGGEPRQWSVVLRISGLVLGALGALSAPFQGGAISVFGTAVIASLFVIEGVRLRNVWLGFPANLVYLMAYFMALSELGLENPQFYAIGAALLGVVMHYLLRRARQDAAAAVTGVLAQLILLSTTYIQLVVDGGFAYFFVIFLQSLVLLVYGLVVRSRSFLIVPILFSVLSVITVTLTLLSGLASVLLIGCTGALLLLFGVIALLMREKISRTVAGWRSRP